MLQLSLIVSVLDSHEVVRRQLLHLGRILPDVCELVLIDDGCDPPLQAVCAAVPNHFKLTLHATQDHRPWTQPRGRNIGASLARAEKLLFFDIEDQANYGQVVEVMDVCRGSGVTTFGLMTK